MIKKQFPVSLNPNEKELLIEASQIEAINLASFIRRSAIIRARETIKLNLKKQKSE